MKRALLLAALATAISNCGAALGDQGEEARAALLALVPPSGAIEGLALTAEPTVYPRDQLADYINGDAESFYPYGVGDTVAAVYDAGDGGRIELDIYDMTTDLGAFGVYAHRRPGKYEPEAIGAEAVVSARQTAFFAGRYFVVVRSAARGDEAGSYVRQLAERIAALIPGPHETPAELGLFPDAGRVPNSERWFPSAFLGLPDMPPVFACDYSAGDEGGGKWKLAFSPRLEGEETARERYADAVAAFRSRALPSTDRDLAVELAGLDGDAFTAELRYRGPLCVVRIETVILMAVGLPWEEAEAALADLANRLQAAGSIGEARTG